MIQVQVRILMVWSPQCLNVKVIRWARTISGFIDIVFFVQIVHIPDINPDLNDENDDGALVGKPEAERETAELVNIELIGEHDAAKVGHGKPDTQVNCNDDKVLLPVRQ